MDNHFTSRFILSKTGRLQNIKKCEGGAFLKSIVPIIKISLLNNRKNHVVQNIEAHSRHNKCKENGKNQAKPCTWRASMYRYSNGQISLADFKQPVGMNLKESNRWVKKTQTIPWLKIEKRYAALFTNRKGNVAKPQ